MRVFLFYFRAGSQHLKGVNGQVSIGNSVVLSAGKGYGASLTSIFYNGNGSVSRYVTVFVCNLLSVIGHVIVSYVYGRFIYNVHVVLLLIRPENVHGRYLVHFFFNLLINFIGQDLYGSVCDSWGRTSRGNGNYRGRDIVCGLFVRSSLPPLPIRGLSRLWASRWSMLGCYSK